MENEDPTWTPRSVLSVTDGLQAARWAYVLVQMGEEEEIMHFIDQMQMRARSRTDKMEQFVMYWHASMWRVAMDMRSGDSFGAATKKILDDMAFYHDHMMKDIASPKSKLKPPPRTDVTDRFIKPGKGGKAGKGSGQDRQGDRYTPYPSPRWQSQSSWRSGGGNAWQGRNYQQNQWREQNHSSCYMSDPRNRDSSGPRLMALLRYPAFGRRPSTVFHRLSRAISAFCCPFSQEWKWRHKQSRTPMLHLTWEVDPECCKVIATHFPQAKHRGDVLKEDASSIINLIDKHDPHQTCAVVIWCHHHRVQISHS